uniref:SCAN box domain-containing protein n=1 Tax=Esox lucius TaxID=8010 RepID=A0A6Q2Y5Y9_ESOLU
MATREGWPKAEWAGLLAPLLTGKPQKAYLDVKGKAASDYVHLKREVRSRYRLIPRDRAEMFHAWKYRDEKSPRGKLFHLIRLVKVWLNTRRSTAEILETLVIDKCLPELPPPMQRVVGQVHPTTVNLLAQTIENDVSTKGQILLGRSEGCYARW